MQITLNGTKNFHILSIFYVTRGRHFSKLGFPPPENEVIRLVFVALAGWSLDSIPL